MTNKEKESKTLLTQAEVWLLHLVVVLLLTNCQANFKLSKGENFCLISNTQPQSPSCFVLKDEGLPPSVETFQGETVRLIPSDTDFDPTVQGFERYQPKSWLVYDPDTGQHVAELEVDRFGRVQLDFPPSMSMVELQAVIDLLEKPDLNRRPR